MITASELHNKILEISNDHVSIPIIHVDGLAVELSVPRDAIFPAIAELEEMGIIRYLDDFVKLTDLGADYNFVPVSAS